MQEVVGSTPIFSTRLRLTTELFLCPKKIPDLPGLLFLFEYHSAGANMAGTSEAGLAVPAELSGWPTGMSQRWPGCPCGGFIPGAVAAGVDDVTGLGTTAAFPEFAGGLLKTMLFPLLPAALGADDKGAPTAMSQRCPGCPCGGLVPGAVCPGCDAGCCCCCC